MFEMYLNCLAKKIGKFLFYSHWPTTTICQYLMYDTLNGIIFTVGFIYIFNLPN